MDSAMGLSQEIVFDFDDDNNRNIDRLTKITEVAVSALGNCYVSTMLRHAVVYANLRF